MSFSFFWHQNGIHYSIGRALMAFCGLTSCSNPPIRFREIKNCKQSANGSNTFTFESAQWRSKKLFATILNSFCSHNNRSLVRFVSRSASAFKWRSALRRVLNYPVNAIKAFDLCVFRFIMFYCVFGVFVILLSLCSMFYDLLVLVRISV